MKREGRIAIAAALPPLILAAAGWIQADAQEKAAKAAKAEFFKLADNYSDYIAEEETPKIGELSVDYCTALLRHHEAWRAEHGR